MLATWLSTFFNGTGHIFLLQCLDRTGEPILPLKWLTGHLMLNGTVAFDIKKLQAQLNVQHRKESASPWNSAIVVIQKV